MYKRERWFQLYRLETVSAWPESQQKEVLLRSIRMWLEDLDTLEENQPGVFKTQRR
jgi:hypothetical protein